MPVPIKMFNEMENHPILEGVRKEEIQMQAGSSDVCQRTG